jgi:hypothetical protein
MIVRGVERDYVADQTGVPDECLAPTHEVDMTDITNRSGGADFHAEEVRVGEDVVGRDKIVQNITQQVAPPEKHDSLPNQPYFFG